MVDLLLLLLFKFNKFRNLIVFKYNYIVHVHGSKLMMCVCLHYALHDDLAHQLLLSHVLYM